MVSNGQMVAHRVKKKSTTSTCPATSSIRTVSPSWLTSSKGKDAGGPHGPGQWHRPRPDLSLRAGRWAAALSGVNKTAPTWRWPPQQYPRRRKGPSGLGVLLQHSWSWNRSTALTFKDRSPYPRLQDLGSQARPTRLQSGGCGRAR